jgi:hypothetical protein
MKSKYFYLTILIFSEIIFPWQYSHSQVIVNLHQPPAYQFHISDMWKLSLNNMSGNTLKVYLLGSATSRKDGKIVEATTATFPLPPGIKFVNPIELAPFNIYETNPKYKDVVQRISGVPTGDYEICVYVLNSVDNAVLGEDCIETQVMNLTTMELIQPEDGTFFRGCYPCADEGTIEWDTPSNKKYIDGNNTLTPEKQFLQTMENIGKKESDLPPPKPEEINTVPLVGGIITFSWLPPVPLPYGAKVNYTLKVAEIFGYQSAYDALQSNPATLIIENIPVNMLQFPAAARRLRPGSRYAWGVDVYINGNLLQTSETRSFEIQDEHKSSVNRRKANEYDHQYGSGFNFALPQKFAMNGMNHYQRSDMGSFSPKKYDVDPIVLTGSGNLEYQYSSRIGSFSQVPKNYFNAILNPGLKLYGLPFTTGILYSTQQQPGLQSMNSFRFNFDFEGMRQGLANRLQDAVSQLQSQKEKMLTDYTKIRNFTPSQLDSAKELSQTELDSLKNSSMTEIQNFKARKIEKLYQIKNMSQADFEKLTSFDTEQFSNLRNPDQLTDNLNKYASIEGTERIFLNVRSFGVGTNYPSYSPYMLSGVPVTGVNLELNPGLIYTAFTASKNQRAIDNMAYLRNIYAGRIGIGQKEGTHLFFNGMYVSDDANSIHLDSTNQTLTPRENYVFGMETRLNLFSEHLSLEGEGSVSLLTRDTRDPQFVSPAIPSFVTKLVKPRLSSSVDFVYSGRLSYANEESATKVSAGIKMIGPGYASLGVPNLRTDQFGYDAKLEQRLFDKHITVSSFFKSYKDNIIEWKSSTTTVTSFGFNLGFNFPKIPFLRLSFSPTQQKNNTSDTLFKIDNNITVYSVMSGYTFPIGRTRFSTTLSVIGQKFQTLNALGKYSTNSLMVGEMVSFPLPLMLGVNYGIIETRNSIGYNLIHNIELNGSAPISEIFLFGAGLSFAAERQHNERIGFSINSTIRIADQLDLDLRLEQNTYNDFQFLGINYQEFLVRCNLAMRF